MVAIDAIITSLGEEHRLRPPASSEAIAHLENLGLPTDLIYFYSKSDGLLLHRSDDHFDLRADGNFWKFEMLPAFQICTIADSGWSHHDSALHLRHQEWCALVDTQDSNYLSISVEDGHCGEIVDTFHETLNMPGYNQIIAVTFTEFLGKLVMDKTPFWLHGDLGYGYY